MEDLPTVAEVEAPQQLEHEQLDVVGVQGTRVLLHVATEVCVLRVEVWRGRRGE